MSRCPSDRPAGAFYLHPLSKPKSDTWFSKVPCGHNTLQKIVPELMKAAGFSGYFTNHSLRASAAVLYHTRMVRTIHVYAYGITIRVWYGLLYHTSMVH